MLQFDQIEMKRAAVLVLSIAKKFVLKSFKKELDPKTASSSSEPTGPIFRHFHGYDSHTGF